MTTPHEQVAAAIASRGLVITVTESGQVAHVDATKAATAAIEALRERAQTLDPYHPPTSWTLAEWEMWCDGYSTALRDVLGPQTQ